MKFKFCPHCASPLAEREVDGCIRVACSAEGCGYVFWNNPTPIVAVIVETEAGILLAHNVTWPKGKYSVITGFLEAGETPEDAAIRETKEETGLTVTSITFVGCYSFYRMNQLVLAYHVGVTGNVTLNDELDDCIFVPKHQLIGWEETGNFQVGEWLQQLRVHK